MKTLCGRRPCLAALGRDHRTFPTSNSLVPGDGQAGGARQGCLPAIRPGGRSHAHTPLSRSRPAVPARRPSPRRPGPLTMLPTVERRCPVSGALPPGLVRVSSLPAGGT